MSGKWQCRWHIPIWIKIVCNPMFISILFSVDSFGLEIDDLSNLESMLSLPYGSTAGHFEGTDCSVSSSVLL